MKDRDDFLDRETTIADMSGLERRSVLFPRRNRSLPSAPAAPAAPAEEKPWIEPEKLGRKERWYALSGAMAAGAVVALVYIVGFALLALIFYFILL